MEAVRRCHKQDDRREGRQHNDSPVPVVLEPPIIARCLLIFKILRFGLGGVLQKPHDDFVKLHNGL